MVSRRQVLLASGVGVAGAVAAATCPGSALASGGRRVRAAGEPPALEGPVTGGVHGYPFASYLGDIDDVGYVEKEYFISGVATRYVPSGAGLTHDGLWSLTPSTTDGYKTRILVRYPKRASDFNGTVIVEWSNVSAGYDILFADPPGIYRAGFAYVSVTAQKVGVEGAPGASTLLGLTSWDPRRYGSLFIPDDALSYDIYTQAASLLRTSGNRVLGGLRPRRLISVGGSQSGSRVTAYTNGVQPLTNAFDSIIPVICAGNASDFDPAPAHPGDGHSRSFGTLIRPDLSIPVFVLNSETEALFNLPNRQPDSATFREWQVTGGSHANTHLMRHLLAISDRDGVTNTGGVVPPGSNVDWQPTLDAIYRHVQRWIIDGELPPQQPKMAINTSGAQPALARDADGNVLGGVRLPELTVPIAAYAGFGGSGGLPGATTPFSADRLRALYPTHGAYASEVSRAAGDAVRQGIILAERATEYVQEAARAPVPPLA